MHRLGVARLVFLFADGERVGGLGSRAFAGQHPLAKRIGLEVSA
jgi:hypothetical protein